jgi:hypothetical protein
MVYLSVSEKCLEQGHRRRSLPRQPMGDYLGGCRRLPVGTQQLGVVIKHFLKVLYTIHKPVPTA